MVKKWGREIFIFHAIIPALYPFLLVKLKYLYSVCLNLNHEKKNKIVTKMGRFKMVVLVKTFDHYDHKFQVFQLSCKIVKELKRNWNLDRNLIITLLIMAICTVVWQALYNFKTKRPRRQDITNFYLKMFKIMRSLRSAKCLKTRAELKFTTQKANTCSSFTACSVFYWKYLFWVNLVQKQIISFLGKFSPNYQFKLKFGTKTN